MVTSCCDLCKQVICEAATGATPALRESAYECMVKIVPNYYDTLPPYMETIFSLTKHAIEKDEEEVAKQAIEFWSSICEEEIDLIDVRDGLSAACGLLLASPTQRNAFTPTSHHVRWVK